MERVNVPAVKMLNICKSFPGVKALNNVSIEIFPGEVVAIVGQNGAGKSTLMDILTGIKQQDEGEIYVKGEKVDMKSPLDAQKEGIAYIHQELTVFNNLTVAENFAISRYDTIKPFGIINYKKINEECFKVINKLDPMVKPTTQVEDLSVGQKQIVEICRAIGTNVSVIIFDEPTASLSFQEKERLFELIRYFKNQEHSIIYITHFLDEVFDVADEAYVLKDGTLVGKVNLKETSLEEIIGMMIGEYSREHYKKEKRKFGKEILRVSMSSAKNGLKDFNFSLHEGEILGVWGLLGSGRTELIRAILGFDSINGKIEIFDKDKGIWTGRPREFTSCFGYVPENKREGGLFLPLCVKDNISIGRIKDLAEKLGMVDKKYERKMTTGQVKQLNIKISSLQQRVENLSGGNQQKVIIARWLMFEPNIFVLDDPTKGLDVGAKVDVHNIMFKLSENGIAMIFTSSDIDEILEISDRILIIANKKQVKIIKKKDADKEILMKNAMRAKENYEQ